MKANIRVCSGTIPFTPHELRRRFYQSRGLLPQSPVDDKPVNWAMIDRRLAEAYSWTAQQVDEMTYSEIYVAFLDTSEKNNLADATDIAKLWAKLSIADKLALAQYEFNALYD